MFHKKQRLLSSLLDMNGKTCVFLRGLVSCRLQTCNQITLKFDKDKEYMMGNLCIRLAMSLINSCVENIKLCSTFIKLTSFLSLCL